MPSSRKNRGSRHRSRHQKPKEDSPPYEDDEDLRHGPLPETDYVSWEVEHLPLVAPPPLVEGPSVLEFEPPPAPPRAPKRKSSLQEPEKSSPPPHNTSTNHNNGPSKKKKGGAPPSLDRWDGGDEEPLPLFSSSSSHNPVVAVAAAGLDFRVFRADPIEYNSQIRQTAGKEIDRLEAGGGGGVGGGGGGEGDVDNRRKSKTRGQISSGNKTISTEDFVPTATDASATVDNKTLRAKSKVSWHNKEASTVTKPMMDRDADFDKSEPNSSTHHHHHHLKEKVVSAIETVKTNPRKSSSSSASKRLDRDAMVHKGAEAELHPSSRRPPEESPYESERKKAKAIDALANSSSPKSGKREESHRQRKAEELQKPKSAEGSLKSFVRDDPVADERKSFAVESNKTGIGIESSIQDNHRNLELEKELENRIRRRKEESADRGRRKDDDTKEREREGSSKRNQHQRVHSRGEGKYREESKYKEEKHRDDKEGMKERLKDEKLEMDSRNRDEKDGDDRYTLGEKVKDSSLRHKERDNDDKDRGGSKRHHHQRESHQRVEKYREEVRHRDDKLREENRREGKHKEERGKDERMAETDSRHSRDDRDNNRLSRHAEEKHASEKEERQQQRKDRDFDERRREASRRSPSRRSPSQYRYEERAKEEVSHRDEKDADGRHGGDERGGGIGEEKEESQKLTKDRDERRRETSRRSPSNALKDARSKEDRPPPSKMRHLEERVDWMPHNNIHMSRPPHSNSMVRPQMGGISSHPSGPSSLLPPPPPLRPGIDNPAVLGNSSGYDDGGMGQREGGRFDRKSGGPYKRSELGGPPGPGDSWRGLRMGNWNGQNQGGPGPNNMFPHFPQQMGVHPPPGAGFMGMGQQYQIPPGMYGPGGAAHRFPIGDSGGGFPPHGHILGWHRPREYEDVHHHPQVTMEGWDGRGPYGDDRQRFGPQEWDQGAMQRMNNRGWEQHPHYGWHGQGMDLGRGFRASSQFHEGPFESPIGGVVVGGAGGEAIEGGLKQVVLSDSSRPVKERSSVVDMQETRELNRASSSPARATLLDTNLRTRSSSSEGLSESKPRRRMMERITSLLLNLDVSLEMAGAGLYEEYLSRLPPTVQGKARAGSTSQGEADALLVSSDYDLEFEADPEAETLISDSQVYPLFLPPVQDSVFKVALDVYRRPEQEGRTCESKFGSFLLPPAASLSGIPDKQCGIEARMNIPCGFQGQKDLEMCGGEDEKEESYDIDYDEACKDALHQNSDATKGLGSSRVCMEVVVAEASERVSLMEVVSSGEGGGGGDNLMDYEELLHISVASNCVSGLGKEPVVVVAAAAGNAACVAVHNVTAGTIGMEGGVGVGSEDGTANVVVVVTPEEKRVLPSCADVEPSGTNVESSLGDFSGCSLEECEEAAERQGDSGGHPMNDSSESPSPLRDQPSTGCEPRQGFGGVCMVEEALEVGGGGILVGKNLVPHHSPCEESTH